MAEYNPSKIIKDGNTYNFRDTTKIPLAGSNQISGSLIPATDNAIDIGSSTSRIKLVYAHKIVTADDLSLVHADDSGNTIVSGGADSTNATLTLMGKNYSHLNRNGYFFLQANDGTNSCILQGTPSGTLTWNGKNVDCVEEQINSPNGYIRYTNGIQICWGAFTNNNNIEPGISSYTFPKAFNAEPRIIVTTNLLDLYFVTATANATTFSVGFVQCFSSPAGLSTNPVVFDYIAIGTWK